MQGNKKHADGQSDSSSIGSMLDETDQEVCSLTDRAFKSLCVDEPETSYPETDRVVSPRRQLLFSSKLSQGPRNHAIHKNVVSNNLLPKMFEHSTFQQLSKDAQEEKAAITNSTPNMRRKLGLPVPNLRHYKHTSKVSSLIKTFDKAENQETPAAAKQPLKNPFPKCPLVCGPDVALRGSQTLLNVPQECSGFSGALQNVGDASRRPGMPLRHLPMDLLCQGTPRFYSIPGGTPDIPQSSIFAVSKKTVKNRTGKASELAGKGSFLHSENSAFESWKAHHKERAGTAGSTKHEPTEENRIHLEEMPCFDECYMPGHKPSPLLTTSVVPKHDVSPDALSHDPLGQISVTLVSLCQSPCLPLSISKEPLAQPPSPPPSGLLVSVHRIPTPPPLPPKVPLAGGLSQAPAASPEQISRDPIPLSYMPQTLVPAEADTRSTDAQTFVPSVTSLPEKTNSLEHDPEVETVGPPWRRQNRVRREIEMMVDAVNKLPEVKDSAPGNPPAMAVAPPDFCITSSDASRQSFNITQLLTPLIPPKQEKEPSESHLLLVTPPLSVAEAAKEAEERTCHCSQNNYKSRASSLLFNLKDIRKRVKSTYSPSPLLRALEGKKKIKDQEGLKASLPSLVEGSSTNSAEDEERSQKASGERNRTQEQARTTNLEAHLQGNYWTLSSPQSKEDGLGYQNCSRLQHENAMDFENGEAELHPKEYSPYQHSSSSKAEQDPCLQNLGFWDPKDENGAQPHLAVVRSQESPTLFFSAEENTNDHESQPCQGMQDELKARRSTCSSEESFVSILDQPPRKESCSLMQLFQKACFQESQRNKDKRNGGERFGGKEEEKSGRTGDNVHDRCLSNHNYATREGKHDGIMQPSEEEDTLKEGPWRERREGSGRSPDLAAEGMSEEPLTPTSSSSFKPNLFMIKDNTFKSAPVIKAVKLPLFRSLSCDGAIAGASAEREKQTHGPSQTVQETDWPLSRNRRQLRPGRVAAATAREGAGSGSSPAQAGCQRTDQGNLAAEATFQEGQGSFYQGHLVEDSDGMVVPAGLAQKEDRDHEKPRAGYKVKARARKPRPSSSISQLNLDDDLAQNQARSPTREKTNYYKNGLLSKRRSGSCMKKVIIQEARSPVAAPESQDFSPASRDAFGDALCSVSLASSTVLSPRPDSTMQSAFRSPFSDTVAIGNEMKAEKPALPSSRHSDTNPTMTETSEPMQTSQDSGPADDFPVGGERPPLMRQMVKTAAKPPAVPPKTEKALRRAKKLASRRKKEDAQPKRPLTESILLWEDSAPVSSAPSPLLPVTPSEPSQGISQHVPSTPTPSSPAIQRKLLQDPASGEYFIVELPVQLKTLYDPESGRYIQVSLPSKRNLSQIPSPEVLAPPYVLYPSDVPLRVSSVPARASPSQLSEPASLVQGALSELAPDWQQDGPYKEPINSQLYFESSVSEDHAEETNEPSFKFERAASPSDQADLVSIGGIEDFALEGIS